MDENAYDREKLALKNSAMQASQELRRATREKAAVAEFNEARLTAEELSEQHRKLMLKEAKEALKKK